MNIVYLYDMQIAGERSWDLKDELFVSQDFNDSPSLWAVESTDDVDVSDNLWGDPSRFGVVSPMDFMCFPNLPKHPTESLVECRGTGIS